MKSFVKKLLWGNDTRAIAIKYGVARGIKMKIEPSSKAQRILGTDEREIQAPFRDYSRKCPVFIDIGASDGYYGLIYHKHNPTGTAYLIDGQARFAAEQKENFKLNGFNTDNTSFLSGLVSNTTANGGIVIDQLLGTKAGQQLFVKIDVDGAEVDVLNGMRGTLQSNNCLLIIETHSLQLERDSIKLLEGIGYTCKIIGQAWWRFLLPENRPTEHNRWFTATKR